MNNDYIINIAKNVFKSQIKTLINERKNISESIVEVVKTIANCNGKIILSGIGKSGHIANKITATFNSIGIKSQYLHPSEALHGDIGLINNNDVIIFISKSGNSPEITKLSKIIKQYCYKIIAITSNRSSILGLNSDIIIESTCNLEECCPIKTIPTNSTTAQLVIGDAIAICLMKVNNISLNDFLKTHPGGSIGENAPLILYPKLYTHKNYYVTSTDKIINSLQKIINSKYNYIPVLFKNKLIGIIDYKDIFDYIKNKKHNQTIKSIIKEDVNVVLETQSISDIKNKMKYKKINSIIIVNKNHEYKGILNI